MSNLQWYKSGTGRTTQRKTKKTVLTSHTVLRMFEREVTLYEKTAISHEDAFPSYISAKNHDSRITVPKPLTAASVVGDVLDFRVRRDPVSGRTVWTKVEVGKLPAWPQKPTEQTIYADPSNSGIKIDDD